MAGPAAHTLSEIGTGSVRHCIKATVYSGTARVKFVCVTIGIKMMLYLNKRRRPVAPLSSDAPSNPNLGRVGVLKRRVDAADVPTVLSKGKFCKLACIELYERWRHAWVDSCPRRWNQGRGQVDSTPLMGLALS